MTDHRIRRYSSGDIYEGHLRNGRRHGRGKLWYANGAKYEGDWIDDERHGKGVHWYPNGDRYTGDWQDDKRHGFGKEELGPGGNGAATFMKGNSVKV